MNTPESPRWLAYLGWMLGTLLLVVAAVGAVNALVDPLGVFGAPRVAGVNALKPYLDHHRELARWQAARRVCARAGIFGNSRAEIGFDPENSIFAAHGLSAFNFAIPGTGATSTYRQLNWLHAAGCMPKTLILGVEFIDFLGGSPARDLPRAESDPPPGIDRQFLAESVFSLSGLRDSLATLLLQRARHPGILTERGFNPLDNYIDEVEQSGHYVLFRQRAEENVRIWTRRAKRLQPLSGEASADEMAVRAILARAGEAGSKVYVVIYPYHAESRILFERLGLGGLFADWKRQIVDISSAQAAHGANIEVWDFSGISPETSEAIPPRGDRQTNMAYYWEAGHFKKELGERMLARLFGEQSRFGIRLDRANVEPWLLDDRAAVQALLAKPSPLLGEADDVLAHILKR